MDSRVLRDLDPNTIERDLRSEVRMIADVDERVSLVRSVQDAISELERTARELLSREIYEARLQGMRWREVGSLFGVSAQRAEQLSWIYRNKRRTEQ